MQTSNFNPLHREGGDPMGGMIPGMGGDFNPLHREGGDKYFPPVLA